ncbi:MAG: pyruvate, water dikinase [Deltaproteobacteria bacterium]|nr:pyruvate, water dikinase [Deltaproteobacteria bacterium]
MSWLEAITECLPWRGKGRATRVPFAVTFLGFQRILDLNNQVLELMADMGDKLGGQFVFDRQYIISSCQKAKDLVQQIIMELNKMAPKRYLGLYEAFQAIETKIDADLAGQLVVPQTPYVLPTASLNREAVEVVGNKNYRLVEVSQVLGLTTPPGFMVTTRAFLDFLDHAGLRIDLRAWLEQWRAGDVSTEDAAEKMRDLVLAAELPPGLERDLRHEAHRLVGQAHAEGKTFAVRSSAVGEDGSLSFAGQYQSVLGVKLADLPQAYRQVAASAYSARALEYRRQWKVKEDQIAMAVGCQLMVDAQAAGVLYTLDPQAPEEDTMLVSAGLGLGEPVVSGRVPADLYRISREAPHTVQGLDVVHKVQELVARPEGGTVVTPVAPERESAPALTGAQITHLADMGRRLESYYKTPQDIEWAYDREGELVILQVRPLNLKSQVTKLVCDIAAILKDRPVIFRDRGAVAQRGIGTGPVYLVNPDEDLEGFPEGGILVARFTSPRLGKVLRRARGVITDVGTPTGHLATIAREYRVPTIVNTGVATQLLTPGMEVTLDAEQNVVYQGTIKELCYYQFTEDAFEDSEEYRLLRRVLRRIASLNLVDPEDKDFTPRGCRSLHDITRFAHEKAVEELVNLEYHHHPGATAKKLKLGIPLGLTIIDIGGGLDVPPGAKEVTLDQVTSLPCGALLEGMIEPGMWATDPMSVDFGSFMSSVTRTMAASLTSPREVGQNLAVVSRDYLNLNLRLGYHFNIIDAYISEEVSANYIYFRFLGGVTDLARRTRRAQFLAEVLSRYDFRTEVRGDLVIGRIKKLPAFRMLEKMHQLGRLVSYSRQLDVKMQSDEEINFYLQEFIETSDGPYPAAGA